MSLGTGIFLSALFLGIIALYLGTKDQWNWRKIAFTLIAGPLAIAVVIAAGVGAYAYWVSVPRPATEFWDIPLGASKDDVRFLKGEPRLSGDELGGWLYSHTERGYVYWYNVEFGVDERVVEVVYHYHEGSRYLSPDLLGIDAQYSLQRLVSKLGEPEQVGTVNDGLIRWYTYPRLNLRVALEKNQVIAYGIYDPVSAR